MKPYYKDDYVTLFHGDCLEVTDWLDADVLVTDPPYGMAYLDRQGVSVANDLTPQARDSALDSWGTKPSLVFGTWKVPKPQRTTQVLVWDKWGGGGTVTQSTSPWAYTHEEVYVAGNWPKTIPGGRAREGGTPSKVSGVLRAPNYNTQARERPNHPTPKPVALMEILIERCPPGIIADPFAGSGATLIAARNLSRQAIGVEIEEKYCDLIATRLAQQAFDFEELMA